MIIEQKMFDLSFLEQMDDKNFIVQVIVLYIHDTHSDLQEMNLEFQSGNYDAVCRTAHKLKSSTGMLQATSLYDILEKTEKKAKDGIEISTLSGLIEAAQAEFTQLRYELEEVLEKI